MSIILPPPAPVVDTRNPTVKATSDASIRFVQMALKALNDMWSAVWGDSVLTPVQAVANLGVAGVGAFTEYQTIGTAILSAAMSAGITSDMIGVPLVVKQIPAGYITSSSDGQTVTLTLPPATTPVGLTVTGTATGNVLNWTAVPGGLNYSIQRSEDNGTTFQEVAVVKSKTTGGGQVVVADITSWTDVDSPNAGTQYQIAVTTPSGTSAYSAPVTL